METKYKRKNKKTCLEKYGCEFPFQNKEIKEKIKNTFFEKYGGWPSQTEHWKEQIAKNRDEIAEKCKQTVLTKYGKEYWFQTKDFQDKLYITKKKNKSFNSSKIEDSFYESLIAIFNKEDIKRQYKDNIRYPFSCDFYICSLDLFIELNLHWSHGFMPFDKENKECIKKLKLWQTKAKESKYYKIAIATWTQRDVKKREVALKNKINYLVVYTYEEIDTTLNNLKIQNNNDKENDNCE